MKLLVLPFVLLSHNFCSGSVLRPEFAQKFQSDHGAENSLESGSSSVENPAAVLHPSIFSQQQQQPSVTTIVPKLILNSTNLPVLFTTVATPTTIGQLEPSTGVHVDPTILTKTHQISRDDLNSVLINIRELLPALSKLEQSLVGIISNAETSEELPAVGNNSTAIDDIVQRLGSSVILPQIHHVLPHPSVKTEEVNIPIPTESAAAAQSSTITSNDNDSPQVIHALIDQIYPKDPLASVIRYIKTLPPRSQEIAYEKLAEKVTKSATDSYGPQDTINLACELHDKHQFDYIASQYPSLVSIYTTFFEGETQVYLEARAEYDTFKNLYFDRSKIQFGITTGQSSGFIFQAWQFIPVPDNTAGCYFRIVSAEAEFAFGIVVTRSEESPLLARNILGVGGVEESKLNERFHWKILPFTPEGGDHSFFVLENRETGLAVEWDEFDRVFPNEVSFSSYQLWDLGRGTV